ncbi:hypothetical protein SAMN04487911_1442 [Arenibacter nanhaiticus]|uniref:Uncharacterized protein n=1 Tax=Arenibacter nanhaiticus TaxID=558155 RepID=A0A1M6ML94_9FLAO|nr:MULTISPECIES: hypothetical protein [Arenibacter]NKI25213.1 hypothetical protein [Arenibacter sp. 6A1]SHJ84237.1 hypothetical protein SAMN04487911_1442 [Arenibacter nanhaiticus]
MKEVDPTTTHNNGSGNNVLIFDSMVGHAAYSKKYFETISKVDWNVLMLKRFSEVHDVLMNTDIQAAVLFIYDKKGLYQLLPFLNRDIHLILCTDKSEVWWLQYNLSNVEILLIDMPKDELYEKIETILFGWLEPHRLEAAKATASR